MHNDRPIITQQQSGIPAKQRAKRSLTLSALFFVATLAIIVGAIGTTFFSPHGNAKAAGAPSITTQQCHDDANNQILSPTVKGVMDVDQAGSAATITITLHYCPAWDSLFGRFVYTYPSDYVLNQDTLPGGYCYIESTQHMASSRSGCTEANTVSAGVPDNTPMDTQITANDGYQWHACWVSTTGGAPNSPICTSWEYVNITVPN